MKRPALCIGFPYVLGLTLASVVSGQMRFVLLGCLFLPGLAVLIWRKNLWKYVLLSTLSCLTACCVYWYADNANDKLVSRAGTETTFTGTITEAVSYTSGYARYALDGTFPDGTAARVEYFTRTAMFSCGDTLTLSGTPEALTSGYLFDAAASAKARRVCLSFGSDTAVLDVKPLQTPTLRSILRGWRETMTRRIRSHMGEETGAMLTGMLFGDKSGMSRTSKTLLYRMGIGHILAVSGLHLDFLALLAEFVLHKLKTGRRASAVLLSVLGILFVLLVGETVSVKRACIMLLIRQCGRFTFRKPDTLNSLSIAAFLLALENPFVIHSAAFWLSVTATWGIAVLAPCMTKQMPRDTVWQAVLADFCACCWCFAAVLPVSILYFREISFLSPLSNTLLLPVCMGAMLFGLLALPFGCQGLIAETLLSGADVMNGWILSVSQRVTSLSWTHAPTGSRVLLFVVVSGGILTAVIYFLSKNRRFASFTVIGALLAASLTVSGEQLVRRGELRLAALGTGKSRLLVLTDGTDAVLVDLTGQKQLSAYAEAYLTETGVSHVESLCLCKPSRKSLRQYETDLALCPPDQVCLLQADFTGTQTVFGLNPYRTKQTEMLFHGARLIVEQGKCTLIYGGMTCIFTNSEESAASPEVLYYYGSPPDAVPECGILFVPAGTPCLADAHTYIGTENTELTLTQSGTCRIRSLYGEA